MFYEITFNLLSLTTFKIYRSIYRFRIVRIFAYIFEILSTNTDDDPLYINCGHYVYNDYKGKPKHTSYKYTVKYYFTYQPTYNYDIK